MKHVNVVINDTTAQALAEIKKHYRLGNDAAVERCIMAAREFLFEGKEK